MKARKTLAALGAALMMIGVSAHASAFECDGNGNLYDPETIQANLIALAGKLRCGDKNWDMNKIGWNPDNPIWERRRMESCDVHQKLARNLYEEREFETGTKPRKNKNNDATGAAWNVRNGQFEEAISKLDALITGVMRSTLNRGFLNADGEVDVAEAQYHATKLVNAAEGAKICIMKLLP